MTVQITARRSVSVALVVVALTLTAACGGGSGFDDKSAGKAEQKNGKASLQVLIASSGDAETKFVTGAADAWAKKSGNSVKVVVAQDIAQQLSQGFAGGNPPDVFYVDAARFADLAKAGSLEPYADQIKDNADFYPSLRTTFSYNGKQYCAPKDFSTLALEIRDDAWKSAGLTDADLPTTWDQLAAVAERLTTGKQTGLVLGDTRDRIGAFMVQAGGWIVNDDATQATADSPANIQALDYVKSQLANGSFKYPSQVDAGWGGEAFGTGKAAMTIEGNWITGAMKNDYPDVGYSVHELPSGPAGKGTLQFTQCWGIAAASEYQTQSVSLVQALTSPQAQLDAAKAFGVMPSRQSVSDKYIAAYPQDKPFVAGGSYGQGPVTVPGVDSVLADFDANLQQLTRKDPEQVLSSLQSNTEAALSP